VIPANSRYRIQSLSYCAIFDTIEQVLLRETEKLLENWKHPDPYRAPTAPGGNKWERNLPARILPCTSIPHLWQAKIVMEH
jgi:hypothetical protein